MSAMKDKQKAALQKALGHLEYSIEKVGRLKLIDRVDWTEEELEVLESFSSRFARASDLFVSRYLRLLAIESDPAFRGTLIDLLNLAEKSGWIDSAKTWFRIRELRNVAAHEYTTDDLKGLYRELTGLTASVLKIGQSL